MPTTQPSTPAVNEVESEPLGELPETFPMPEGEERTVLRDVSGGESFGEATRSFVGGTFTHKVLANLPDPEPGFFYEGWLVRPSPFRILSTGKMIKSQDGKYVLSFSSKSDLRRYTNVVITIEPDDGDPAPAGHILEGSF